MLLFFGVFLFSGLSPVATSFDSRWTVFTVMSLWERGDANLDEYGDTIEKSNFYGVMCVDARGNWRNTGPLACDGHWYSSYSVAVPVLSVAPVIAAVGILRLAAPILAPYHASHPVMEALLRADWQGAHAVIEMEAASLALALAALVMYRICLRFIAPVKAVALAVLFATATPAYSVAGRGLWAHTFALLCFAITIYLFIASEQHPVLAAWAGLPVALAYTIRPTGSVLVIVCTLFVWFHHRRYFVRYLIAAAPVAALFFSYNLATYHALLSPYYQIRPSISQQAYWTSFAGALAGNLASPGRGLLIYTPIFVVAIWNMFRGRGPAPVAGWLRWIALVHWITISSFVQLWWAGHSYGPRFFTELTPVFVLFLIPVLQHWESYSRPLRALFMLLALVSLAMHVRGGWSQSVYQWNATPLNVDEHPERNWDWSDPPFLRSPLIGPGGLPAASGGA